MRQIFVAVAMLGLVGCGGGGSGGDMADRAVKEADALCKCSDTECARTHMKELNKMSIKDGDKVEALDAERKKVYDDAQSRAAECQLALKQK